MGIDGEKVGISSCAGNFCSVGPVLAVFNFFSSFGLLYFVDKESVGYHDPFYGRCHKNRQTRPCWNQGLEGCCTGIGLTISSIRPRTHYAQILSKSHIIYIEKHSQLVLPIC